MQGSRQLFGEPIAAKQTIFSNITMAKCIRDGHYGPNFVIVLIFMLLPVTTSYYQLLLVTTSYMVDDSMHG